MTQTTIWRVSAIVLLTASLFVGVQRSSLAADEHHATPGPSSCDSMATPGNHQSDGANHAMSMSTPVAAVEIDLLYIDMMIPHHALASIIALSQVALPHLQDERLRTMAQAIIDTQAAEIEELKGYRLRFFGDAEPQSLDESGMMQLMGDSSKPMDAMMREMDGKAQIAAFCAAADARSRLHRSGDSASRERHRCLGHCAGKRGASRNKRRCHASHRSTAARDRRAHPDSHRADGRSHSSGSGRITQSPPYKPPAINRFGWSRAVPDGVNPVWWSGVLEVSPDIAHLLVPALGVVEQGLLANRFWQGSETGFDDGELCAVAIVLQRELDQGVRHVIDGTAASQPLPSWVQR